MSPRSCPPRPTSCGAALVTLLALSSAALVSIPGSVLAADVLAADTVAEKSKPAPAKPAAKAPAAADRDTARRLVLEGDAFYDRQEFARALERYSEAYRVMRVPTVGIEVIKAQTALGKLVEAQAVAQEVSSTPKKRGEPAVFEEARRRAAQSNLRLTGMIPSLWLEVSPAGVVFEIQIDGVTPPTSPPYQLNPGPHKVRVMASGYQTRHLDIVLREAERLNRRADLVADGPTPAKAVPASVNEDLPAPVGDVPSRGAASKSVDAAPPARAEEPPAKAASVQDEPAAAKPGSSLQTLGWVGLAVTGLAAGVGTYAGIKAFSSKPDCPNDTCTPSQQDDIDSSERMGTIANVSVGVAVVAGALSIWALASGGADDSKESASLYELPVRVSVGKLNEIRVSGHF